MDDRVMALARECLDASLAGTMTFPETITTLTAAGFEGYAIDFRMACATYYRLDGTSVVLSARLASGPVAPTFDATLLKEAISESQRQAPGYTFSGFCEKAVAAGCAGYFVSFSGRRALYVARTAETHVEYFPD